MAKSNYNFQKRQKEMARKKKKEEKRQRKLERKSTEPIETSEETIHFNGEPIRP
ncbi:MAG: hypothetical protein P8165_15640 [Deltaproteobacteria bacterium]|jgi:hypothetical protein